MKTLMRVLATTVPVAVALSLSPTLSAQSATPATGGRTALPADAGCANLKVKPPPGSTIESLKSTPRPGGTIQFPVQPGYQDPPPPVTNVPSYCEVDVVLNHANAGDHELIKVWLPQTGWSGRFQALGGAGYSAGDFGPSWANAVKQGYAVATTDAGATPVTGWTSPWALDDHNQVRTGILRNFADRSPHDLAVIGKAVTNAYYGKPAAHAYWNGCSTGGRQGYVEAQRHPQDFDGILANAPAISWDRFAVAALWPSVVLNREKDPMSKCELAAFTTAATNACDARDGNRDGVIGDPLHCDFKPSSLIGQVVNCDGGTRRITAEDATVVSKIWNGPKSPAGNRLWFGLPRGAALESLASPKPFPVAASWVQDFVKRDRTFDVTSISDDTYTQLFHQSVKEYHAIIGSDDANLSAFRRSGGKLLTWQGLGDQLVPVGGTIRYYKTVRAGLHQPKQIDHFYRLFLAPGAAHCSSGVGPAASDPLAALVTWVEHGKAPHTLTAVSTGSDGSPINKRLCRYPLVSKYDGHGDPSSTSSFTCVKS